MLCNVSSRIATRNGLNGFLPVVDIAQQRFLNIELPSPKRPFPLPTRKSQYSKNGSEAGDSQYPKASGNHVAPLRHRETSPGEKHMLRPAVLSERLKKLCNQGKLDDAVAMLKSSPQDAQNTIVWNTMISLAMNLKHFKLAYQLYIDMKRRGFLPNYRTFNTLMTGYGKVEDWRAYSKQLENVHNVYQNFKDWFELADIAQMDPADVKFCRAVTSTYISILGDARLYQKMFDVYHSMPLEGPTAPDEYTFSGLLHAISERREPPEGTSREALFAQNASDAKLLWKQMMKAAEKSDFGYNAYVVTSMIRCLMRGRPSDVLYAFDIIRDHCGLSKPGETPQPAKIALTYHAMLAIIDICNMNQKYRLAIHYVQQIMDRPLPKGEPYPLDRKCMDRVLHSYACLASLGSLSEADQALETLQWMLRQEVLNPQEGQRFRPQLETYALVLTACWRGADWRSATRTFELLTGCHAEDFRDNATGAPKVDHRSPGRTLEPDSNILSSMLRTAFNSKDAANMRQCLRMVDFHKVGEVLDSALAALPNNSVEAMKFAMSEELGSIPQRYRAKVVRRNQLFYGVKLAEAMVDVVSIVIPRANSRAITGAGEGADDEPESYVLSEAERMQWSAFRSKARKIISSATALKIPMDNPRYEDNPLGSQRALDRVDQRVEWEMSKRTI